MTMLAARVRKAGKADIDRIIDIERSWRHLSHWSIDSYYRLISDDATTATFVAEREDDLGRTHIAGFVIFNIVAGVAEIYNIAVEASSARQGIGGRLMRATIEECRRRQAKTVMLEVRKSNQPAITFYYSFNFHVVGERKSYYSNPVEDAFVMEVALDQA
ncbi:MAG TPA: ribosomal protein S18-alanine N-acetyltransferase [Terriglobia bacterium]|nr:ribosomal protein S18-alanine N-acetyltransferase [Terriglobia bacterium]